MSDAFKTLLLNIANLFKVKTILSLSVIATTCVLTVKGNVSTEAFMAIAGSIITYYFTKKENKNSETQNEVQSEAENVENTENVENVENKGSE